MFGDVSSIYNNASASTLPTDTSKTDYKQEFLQLLLTNLKHQDPTKPFDSSDMIAQQAQFASLEQMQNMNNNFVTLMAMQNVSQAAGLLGKTVSDGSVSGVVQGLRFLDDGTPILTIDNAGTPVEMSVGDVKSVSL